MGLGHRPFCTLKYILCTLKYINVHTNRPEWGIYSSEYSIYGLTLTTKIPHLCDLTLVQEKLLLYRAWLQWEWCRSANPKENQSWSNEWKLKTHAFHHLGIPPCPLWVMWPSQNFSWEGQCSLNKVSKRSKGKRFFWSLIIIFIDLFALLLPFSLNCFSFILAGFSTSHWFSHVLRRVWEGTMDPIALMEAIVEEVACPICMTFLKEPVSIDCGHSFCHSCLSGLWQVPAESQNWGCTCPLCRAPVQPRNLRPNWQLASVAEKVRLLQLCPGMGLKGDVCELHGEQIKMFCKADGLMMCEACSRCPEHEAHSVLPMEDVAWEYKVGDRAWPFHITGGLTGPSFGCLQNKGQPQRLRGSSSGSWHPPAVPWILVHWDIELFLYSWTSLIFFPPTSSTSHTKSQHGLMSNLNIFSILIVWRIPVWL